MLDGAEKIETPKDRTERDRPNYLADRADRWCSAMANRAAAQQATLEKLTASATAAWPGIAGTLKAEEGFTPDKLDQFKGKIIHLKGNNRLG